MTKQREAFEKWFESQYARMEDSTRFSAKGIAYSGWQAAQADKLEFARKVAEAVRDSIFSRWAQCDNNPMSVHEAIIEVDIYAISAEVEQEQ
jgi:hypothetical protein